MRQKCTSCVGFAAVGALALLTSCSSQSDPGVADPPATSAATTAPSMTVPPSTVPPSTVPATPAAAEAAFDAVITVVGSEETVFQWSTMRCTDDDIPDLAARAFRDAAGTTHLVLSNPGSVSMNGSSLDDVSIDCTAISTSALDPDPARFADHEWLAAPYTSDGTTVHALVHNEFQGHTHPGICPTGDYFDCWDNSITMAVSTDGGASFSHLGDAPAHLVATPPKRYSPDNGPSGYRSPSNIIAGRDGLFYAYFNVSEPSTQREWVCAMRTDDLNTPSSWRYHDGSGFDGVFVDPYTDAIGPTERGCPPFEQDDIGHALNGSVSYLTELDQYVMVGISADQIDGREVWGVYYSFSDDLVDWSRRKLLMEIPLPYTVANPGSDLSYLYPSLLDPDSTAMNYDTVDDSAYLYLTRNNAGHASLDRDLVRYEIQFSS